MLLSSCQRLPSLLVFVCLWPHRLLVWHGVREVKEQPHDGAGACGGVYAAPFSSSALIKHRNDAATQCSTNIARGSAVF